MYHYKEKNEGIKLSEGLIENHIPISSSETLLLKNATEDLDFNRD